MKRLYFIITALFLSNVFYAQEKRHDIEKKILIHLYEDDAFKFLDDTGKVINDFSLLDIVKIDYDYMEAESNQYTNFDFYSFKIDKINLISKNDSVDISIAKSYTQCSNFILAFNLNKIYNYTYRLKGFSTNDLLYLLADLTREEKKDMKFKDIVEDMDLIFEDLDIRCMYKSIMKLNFSSECFKSDCYRKRPYSITAHGKKEFVTSLP